MKETSIRFRSTDSFKKRVKKECDYRNLTMTQFIVEAVEEKLRKCKHN